MPHYIRCSVVGQNNGRIVKRSPSGQFRHTMSTAKVVDKDKMSAQVAKDAIRGDSFCSQFAVPLKRSVYKAPGRRFQFRRASRYIGSFKPHSGLRDVLMRRILRTEHLRRIGRNWISAVWTLLCVARDNYQVAYIASPIETSNATMRLPPYN